MTAALALFEPEYATNHRGQKVEACSQVDPEVMFAEDPLGIRSAKYVCGRCAFQIDCLEGALARREEYGVWGGLTYNEREALRKRKQRARRLF